MILMSTNACTALKLVITSKENQSTLKLQAASLHAMTH
jgi:hypothetical protein